MPYIKPILRVDYDAAITNLLSTFDAADVLEAPGILNYIFSKIVHKLFKEIPSYKMANTLIGVLESVKQEFYRRPVAEYEECMMVKNGDL